MPDGSPAPPRPEEELPSEPADDAAAEAEAAAPPEAAAGEDQPTIPAQELARMWQSGQQMDVATELMFTPASYADFVDLCFVIGQAEGRKLGHMLDELADSENIPVPDPSTDYSSVLQRVAADRGGRSMVPSEV